MPDSPELLVSYDDCARVIAVGSGAGGAHNDIARLELVRLLCAAVALSSSAGD